MPLPQFASKAISVSLLILSISAALSAQSIAALKGQAESGDALAQNNLGLDYYRGEGVPQDYAQAAVWWRKAAEQGQRAAQLNLGQLYDQGRGVPQDNAQAAVWYRKAGEQGVEEAQLNLGVLYYTGRGVPQNYGGAAVWWRKAAEQGDSDGQLKLGISYSLGLGVPQDYEEAYFWLDLAASNQEGVTKERDNAASHLTPADLSRAQERARKWFEDHSTKPSLQIKSGSTVYIEPVGGYETYLAAAIVRVNVPLAMVTDKGKADYIITGSISHKDMPQPAAEQPTVVVNNSNKNIFNGNERNNPLDAMANRADARRLQNDQEMKAKIRALGETSVSITVVDPRTSQIVYADAEGAEGSSQVQRATEACAKHLLDFINKKM
jgi:hypothetical protein